jgi:hypothetical protein
MVRVEVGNVAARVSLDHSAVNILVAAYGQFQLGCGSAALGDEEVALTSRDSE